MASIFLDESGYTGEDLFRADQRVFVLSSINIDEHEAQELKEKYFSGIKADELKHSRMIKYPKQKRMVLDFMNYVKDHPDLFIISATHKRFAIICKIVDFLIEPYYHYYHKFDLYERGLNISLSNLLFYTIPVFGSQKLLDNILLSFQELIRYRTKEHYMAFSSIFRKKYNNSRLEWLFDYFRASLGYFGMNFINGIPKGGFDLALTDALNVMAMWRGRIEGDIWVIHDSSSNMSKQQDIWNALMDKSIPPQTIGYDYRKMTFPISVEKTVFEESKKSAGLQLADVIAGTTAKVIEYLRINDSDDDYSKNLSSIFSTIRILPLLPEPKISPEETGAIGTKAGDPLEFIGNIIQKVNSKK